MLPLVFLAERIAKRIDTRYQNKLNAEFEKFKGNIEHRKYISQTQFEYEFQIYKQLSKAFYSVNVKASSFAYTREHPPKNNAISRDTICKIIETNADAQDILFENAPFIPEEIYDDYCKLYDKTNAYFWSIMERIEPLSKPDSNILEIITEDDIATAESFQQDLSDINSKVRQYLGSLSIINSATH